MTPPLCSGCGTTFEDGQAAADHECRGEPDQPGLHQRWPAKAAVNEAKWGEQEIDTLLLAMQEELGELTQAYLEAQAEGGNPRRIADELDDLAALCIQLDRRLSHV